MEAETANGLRGGREETRTRAGRWRGCIWGLAVKRGMKLGLGFVMNRRGEGEEIEEKVRMEAMDGDGDGAARRGFV